MQADKWAAERRAEEAVRIAHQWRAEAKRLQAELDRLLAREDAREEAR